MKHLVSVVALACLVMSTWGTAHATSETSETSDWNIAAQNYCNDAVRAARTQVSSDDVRNWQVTDAYYEEWREAGWEQFRCVVEAECRCDTQGSNLTEPCSTVKDGDVWQHTAFAGSVLEIRQLACQSGWLKPR